MLIKIDKIPTIICRNKLPKNVILFIEITKEESMTNTFGKNLMELRKKNGLSQEDLANKLNVTRQTVSKWELEQTSPSLKDLKNIADFFNISLDELTSNDINISTKESINQTNNIKLKTKKKYLILLPIIVLIIFFIILINRSYRILYIKKQIDLANISQNYYINKITMFENFTENKIIENYKLYFLNGKIKLVTMDTTNNLLTIKKIEIFDDKSYYCIDEINKSYYQLPIDEYYKNNKDSILPIQKDPILNEIYKKFTLSSNKDLLNLIINTNFKTINEFNDYYTITNIQNELENYISLQTSTQINKLEYINNVKLDNEYNNLTQHTYLIELNKIENKDFELPNLLEYQKLDI